LQQKRSRKKCKCKIEETHFCLLLLSISVPGFVQTTAAEPATPVADTTVVNDLLEKSKGYFTDSPQKTIELATQAKQIAESLNFKKGEAYALKNIGVAYYFQGKYLEALDFYQQSLNSFTEIKDYVGMANIYSNMGVVYYDQSDDVKP
jgi:tetratricopeptide (TPR) repeat protein